MQSKEHLGLSAGRGGERAKRRVHGRDGVVVGALAAETYRLSLPRHAVASASLTAREPARAPRRVVVARVVAAAALVGAVAGAATGHTGPLVAAVLTGATVAVAETTLRAVRTRRRPVLSDRAHWVDARVRAFAEDSVAWLEVAVAALGAAWVVSLSPLPRAAAWPQVLVVLAGLVATVVLLRKASPRPRRGARTGVAVA